MVASGFDNLYSFSRRTDGEAQNILMVANPGAGKTEEIANFAVKLIGESVPPEKILCITFTNKAAAEMRRRIDQKLSNDRLAALGVEVTTFHSLAFSALSLHGNTPQLVSSNFLKYSILSSVRNRNVFNYGDAYISGTLVPKIENAIRYIRSFSFNLRELDRTEAHKTLETFMQLDPSRLFSPEEIEKFLDYMLEIISDYEEKKIQLGLMDYNDLLSKYLEIPDGQELPFEWVLVDELQDLNEVEFEIAIKSGKNHFMVGDPKQSIFGFQGGSLKNFRRFRETFGSETEILGKNRRSTEEILSYARSFYKARSGNVETLDELEQLLSAEGKRGDPVVLHLSEEPEKLASVLAAKYDTSDQTVAVITRTNSQIDLIGEYLDRNNIQYRSTSPGSPDESSRSDIMKYLMAVVSPSKETIIPALFTPYSEVTLEEAFRVADQYRWARKLDLKEVKKFAPSLHTAITDKRSKEGLSSLFKDKIVPIAISLGKAHFIAAHAINHSVLDYFKENINPQLDGLFDYLSVSGIELEVGASGKGLVLTTVHKAKGMEFDHVIYVPSRTQERLSFVDMVSRTLVKVGKGFDPFEELGGEDDRVDFVAITRAKDVLEIICRPKYHPRYTTGSVTTKEDDAEDTSDPLLLEFDRVFSLIAHGRKEEAIKAARSRNLWLTKLVRNYFRQEPRLSYSSISSLSSPIRFLSNYILNLFETSKSLRTGSLAHDYAQSMFEGEDLPEDLGDLEPIVENVKKVMNAVREEFDADQIAAEMPIQLHVADIYPDFMERYPETIFKGKIDAVFKSKTGNHIILDYKTDQRKSEEYVREHRLQLYIYKMMYAKKYSIDPSKVRVCTGYINLKNRINTGKVEHSLDLTEPSRAKINNFKGLISRYFDYRDNPDKFIDDVLSEHNNETHLQAEIKRILGDEISALSSN